MHSIGGASIMSTRGPLEDTGTVKALKRAAELPYELREKLFVDSLKAQRKDLKPRFAQKLEKIGRWGGEEVFLNAPESVRNDPDLAAIAVRRCPAVYQHLSDELKNNVAVILPAVKEDWINWEDFYSINRALSDNREVMMAVVQVSGHLLEDANERLKADKEVVMAAVQNWGEALEEASDELKGDKEVVLVAVQQNGSALRYANNVLKGDKEVVLAAVQQTGYVLWLADDALKDDKEVVLTAVQQYGGALMYASDALKGDKEVVLAAVQQDGEALKYASDALKGDKEIVTAAVQQNRAAFQFVDNELMGWVRDNAF